MSLHIFRARDQPATRYKVDFGNFSTTIQNRRRTQIWARCCKRKRWATYLVAHVYYDGIWYYCRRGRGCKHNR